MKKIFNAAFMMLAALTISLSFESCTDETALFGSDGYGDGKATVTLDFSFEALNNALDTRGTQGDLDFGINNLVILFYNANENDQSEPVYAFDFQTDEFDVYEKEPRGPAHCEEKTYHGMVTLEDVEYGDYRIYAVANVKDELKAKMNESKYAITEDELRTISIKWPQSTNGEQKGVPDAMFGYFTYEDPSQHHIEDYRNVIYHPNHEELYLNKEESSTDHTSPNPTPTVTLNKRNLEIQAWLKRVVSKLTIGFDGTNLKDGVEIYIKSVRIADAARTCLLGQDNSVKDKSDFIIYNPEDVEQDPRLYTTYESEAGDAVVKITRATPAYPRDGDGLSETLIPDANSSKNKVEDENNDGWHDAWYEYVHGSTTNTNPTYKNAPTTLYFFENLQGVDKKNTKVKLQTKEGVKDFPNHLDPNHSDSEEQQNEDDLCLFYKDGKPNGTYVEVKAYYKNTKTGKNSQGDITYRFMLGKNIENDFNAERNHHYKLTLSFIGDANNVDWHIDYEEEKEREEGFYFRIPYNLDDTADDYGYMDKDNNEYWYENENWKQSYVWYAYDKDNNPIAEICKELIYYDAYEYKTGDPRNEKDLNNPILRKFYQVVTIYPMDQDGDVDFGHGIIAQVLACDSDEPGLTYQTKESGAKISMCWRHEKNENVTPASSQHRGDCAIVACELNNEIANGHDESSHENYWYAKYDPTDESITLIDTPLDTKLETRPYKEKDVDENLYSIVKIGTSYWFRENLRTTHYLEGPEIALYHENVSPKTDGDVYLEEGEAMYKNDPKYGYLYNLAALTLTSDLDPYLFGWSAGGNQAVLMQKDTEDWYDKTFWQYNGRNVEVDYRLAPAGWHIPVNCLIADLGIFYNRTADQDYLADYLSDNYARAIVDTDYLKWPSFPGVKQPNLSGLSLLAIPADGYSESIKFDFDIGDIQNGDLANIAVPFWLDTFVKPHGENYFYAVPRFLHLNNEYYLEETLVNGYSNDAKYTQYFKEISKQYLPIRPCRNPLVFRPRSWEEIGELWYGIPNRNNPNK